MNMKKTKTIDFAKRVLNEKGNMTTDEILTAIKEKWPKRTPSVNSLSNILAKNPDFIVVGVVMKKSMLSGSYEANVWGLADE